MPTAAPRRSRGRTAQLARCRVALGEGGGDFRRAPWARPCPPSPVPPALRQPGLAVGMPPSSDAAEQHQPAMRFSFVRAGFAGERRAEHQQPAEGGGRDLVRAVTTHSRPLPVPKRPLNVAGRRLTMAASSTTIKSCAVAMTSSARPRRAARRRRRVRRSHRPGDGCAEDKWAPTSLALQVPPRPHEARPS